MAKKQTRLEAAQSLAEAAVIETNKKIDELGSNTEELFDSLTIIQGLFDTIRNIPSEDKLKYEKLKKIRLNWKDQVQKMELEFKKADSITKANGAAGVGAGVAVASLGPTAAMGIATTFGVASTGTAISSLSGVAATRAALAWLGGGALAAGGGGMVAGNALIALAGPIGWTIAGVSLLSSIIALVISHNDKEILENIFTLISERDTKNLKLSIVELSERIDRIKRESQELLHAIARIRTFGKNYHFLSIKQKHELGAYVNLMESSTMLLVNPIMGLQPKFTESDIQNYAKKSDNEPHILLPVFEKIYLEKKELYLYFGNLLYNIPLDDKSMKLLANSFKKNDELLNALGINKKDMTKDLLNTVKNMLDFKEGPKSKIEAIFSRK